MEETPGQKSPLVSKVRDKYTNPERMQIKVPYQGMVWHPK